MDLEGVMLGEEVRRRKMSTITLCDLPQYVESEKTWIHRHRGQIGNCQSWGECVGDMSEGGQRVQTPSYRICKPWDVMHSVVTVVKQPC